MLHKWMLAAVTALCLAPGARADGYTYADLVKRLTDLEALAVLPKPGNTCQQASSYDRASRLDPATGRYVAWDANGDGGGVIRAEGDQLVLAEMEGPGCIWRIWSAAPGKGRVRIYLDGDPIPAVDLPFAAYFDGKHAPFVYPSLVHDAASGKNAYVPIPFQRSCKVVAERNWGLYYHFTWERFPAGTTVPTFRQVMPQADLSALRRADEYLTGRLGEDPAGPRRDEQSIERRTRVAPGAAVTVARIDGPRAVTALRVRPRLGDRKDEVMALRELVLRVTFDDAAAPAVWSPLGDFFGTAPGINHYRSLPLGMTEDGFYSFWYMPFARGATVEIVNEGKSARTLDWRITHAPLDRPVEQLGRFHAKWHRDAFLPPEPERHIEWTMLQASGAGRFCGVSLHVWNPKGGWWGEGDEMFYVDGERFPSTFGTGSEDYFGYAWCNPARFVNAFHNQPFNSGNNRGHASVNRWHVADSVPFQTSFFGSIEKYYPNDRPTLYAAVPYWYQRAGSADAYGPTPVAERIGYFEVGPLPATEVKGATEGETMVVLERTGGDTSVQDLSAFGPAWSKDKQVWWTGGRPGDRLTLTLPVRRAGRYDIKLQMTCARDYGIVQWWLDGEKLGDPQDLYSAEVVPTGELILGTRQLTAGEHRLVAEIVGANPSAVPAHMVGLDYVLLAPANAR
ncbi:MAG: DUF2961 domain-containing protein [Chthonomonadales bacterium]|nr:DUF2961 domain-containing protein [Chthonomonadales bacterium]